MGKDKRLRKRCERLQYKVQILELKQRMNELERQRVHSAMGFCKQAEREKG